jgi:hypothetical protein
MIGSDDVEKAINDGSVYRQTPEVWQEMLAATTRISGHNPTLVHRMNQAAELLRHLLRSHESERQLARASADAREQHKAVFTIGSRTLRWTIVAAVAAVIGAVAAIIAIFR